MCCLDFLHCPLKKQSELASECALCFKMAYFFTLQYSWMSNKIFVAVDVVLKATTLGSLGGNVAICTFLVRATLQIVIEA